MGNQHLGGVSRQLLALRVLCQDSRSNSQRPRPRLQFHTLTTKRHCSSNKVFLDPRQADCPPPHTHFLKWWEDLPVQQVFSTTIHLPWSQHFLKEPAPPYTSQLISYPQNLHGQNEAPDRDLVKITSISMTGCHPWPVSSS